MNDKYNYIKSNIKEGKRILLIFLTKKRRTKMIRLSFFIEVINYFLIALTVCFVPSFIFSTTKYIPSLRSLN